MKPATIIVNLFCLGAGFGIGFMVSKSVYEKKYQKYADEEIESVKKVYEKHFKTNTRSEQSTSTDEPNPKKAVKTATSLDRADDDNKRTSQTKTKARAVNYNAGYSLNPDPIASNYMSNDPIVLNDRPTEVKLQPKNIYIMSPTEFQEAPNGTKTVTLFYYRDGILADDDYNIIKHPETIIGEDALNSFGRYEDDAVYVRNEDTKTDYEILLDNRCYSDVSPHGSGAPSDD